MRFRITAIISVCSIILIGCATFPQHPDRNPTIWEVITAYTNPQGQEAALTGEDEATEKAEEADTGEKDEASGPTATLLPGTRVSVAQTRVHETKIAMTAAVPTGTLLPGTRVAVAQTRFYETRQALTATPIVTGTATPASGTRVAANPTQAAEDDSGGDSGGSSGGGSGDGSDDSSDDGTPATARPTSTKRSTTPTATPTKRPVATRTPTRAPTKTLAPTKQATSAATPTRRVAPTPGETPTSPPSPPEDPIREDVYIRSHVGAAEEGEFVVVGEIINGEDYPIFGARVVGTFYDASGNLIGAQEEMAIFPKTHTEQPNPFRLAASDPAGQVESYELTLVWEDISVVDFAPILVQSTEVDDDDKLELSGELLNDQSTDLTSIIVTVTFYDEDGAVIAAYDNFYGAQTLSPGDTMPYSVSIPDPELEYDTFYVQAQGNLSLY